MDIARGLNYLHTRVEDERRIIHRDIKSDNILLGKNWEAKIADFGLYRFYPETHEAITLYTDNVAGTYVYLDPEYQNTGKLKKECLSETQNERPTAEIVLKELEKALSFQKTIRTTFNLILKDIKNATTPNEKAVRRIIYWRRRIRQGNKQRHLTHANGRSSIAAKRSTRLKLYVMKRLKICIEVATGLAFLHGGALTKEMVIHRDIKSANILLNDEWKAKISDFGLSLITPVNEETEYVISNLVGTIGYVDPLYESMGFLTKESDVYSFGVVLFEIMHGKLLVPDTWSYNQQYVTKMLSYIHIKEIPDWIVFYGIRKEIAPESLSTFRMIVSQCLDDDRKKRPTAEEVLRQLNIALEFQILVLSVSTWYQSPRLLCICLNWWITVFSRWFQPYVLGSSVWRFSIKSSSVLGFDLSIQAVRALNHRLVDPYIGEIGDLFILGFPL
ncbi:kinase-like domain, phloem protein 2-like protein [Tanacetum coccineum]